MHLSILMNNMKTWGFIAWLRFFGGIVMVIMAIAISLL